MTEELEFALRVARAAGGITLKYFNTDTPVERKADDSPVSRADREAETYIRNQIALRFPHHGILGEEFEEQPGDGETRWVIDPIDGTKSFVYGVPLFAVLVGLERDGIPVMGVAHFPALNETLWAEQGGGAFCNGEAIRVSSTDRIEDALLVSGSILSFEAKGTLDGYIALAQRAYATRTWGDAYGHSMVARGKAEVMLDPRVNVWDTCALTPIVLASGGTFTSFDGGPGHGVGEALSTNGRLLQPALNCFADNQHRPNE
ncbi:MAG: inositol monophosphatase family protein [Armatimonadetes bacterium]|nr:inositol monophosphatase family protein [Armatimonadota bacterium]